MLNLKTMAGERLELPESAVQAVTLPSNGEASAGIIFNMGDGDRSEMLADQYGFVKKLMIDSHLMINALEVTPIEPVPGGEPGEVALGKLFFSRDRIIGRKEVKDDPRGINAILFLNLFGRTQAVSVADTLDEMDGVIPEKRSAKVNPPSLVN